MSADRRKNNDSESSARTLEGLAKDFEESARIPRDDGKASCTTQQLTAACDLAARLIRAELARRSKRRRQGRVFLCVLISVMVGWAIYHQWRVSEPDYWRTLTVEVSSPGHRFVEVYWDDPARFPEARTVLTQAPVSQQEWKVNIEVLAERNPSSRGNSVVITGIYTPERKTDLSAPEIQDGLWSLAPDPWAASGQKLIAPPGGGGTISTELSGGTLNVEYWVHPGGGKLKVEANGHAHYIDTFNSSWGIEQFRLNPAALAGPDFVHHSTHVKLGPWEWDRLIFRTEGGTTPDIRRALVDGEELQSLEPGDYRLPKRLSRARRSAIAAGFTGGLIVFLTALAGVALWTNPKRTKLIASGLPLLLSLGSTLFWIAIFNPGNFDNDSWSQWGQALRNQYHTWYPPLMAMLMHGVQAVSGNLSVYTFIQSLLLWLPIFLILRDTLASNRAWLIACVAFVVNPVLWSYSVTIMKDVGTAASGLWAIWFFVRYLRSHRSWDFWSGAWCYAVMTAFRVNSVLIVGVPLAIVLLERRGGVLRSGIKCLGVVILCLAPGRLAEHSPMVTGKASFFGPLFMSSYVGIVSKLPPKSAEFQSEQEKFDGLFGKGKLGDYIAIYDPKIIVGILMPLGGKLPPVPVFKLEEQRGFILTHTAMLALRHPIFYLNHKFTNAQVLFQYPAPSTLSFPQGVVTNDLGIIVNPRLSSLRQQVVDFGVWCTGNTPIFRHYLLQILALVALAFLVYFRAYSGIFIFANSFVYTLSLVIPDMFGEWRYLLFSYLCNWLCLISAIACLTEALSRKFRLVPSAAPDNSALPSSPGLLFHGLTGSENRVSDRH